MAKRTRKAKRTKRTGRARRPKAGTRARKTIRKAGARAMNVGRARKKRSARRRPGVLSSVTRRARRAMDAAVGAASTAVKNVTR